MSTTENQHNTSKDNQQDTEKNYCIDFHGAAVIDQDGHEVAITEEMIENACNELINDDAMTPYLGEHSA